MTSFFQLETKMLPEKDLPEQQPVPEGSTAEIEKPELPRPEIPKLLVFGGSFDPIHCGHLAIAEKLLELKLCDEVMFVPAALPPHQQPKDLAAPEHRLAMLNLVLPLNPAFSCSDIELNREGPSYTFDTLTILARLMPDTRISFLIGMDSLLHLHEWHRASELVQQFPLLVYPRPGFNPPAYTELIDRFGRVNARKLMDSIISQEEELPVWDISSSTIRDKIRRGGKPESLLPPPVWQYIQEQGLYLHD